MKIIEFCGLPGCGKSTLCDQIEKILSDSNCIVNNLQKPLHVDKPNIIRKTLKMLDYLRYLCFMGNRDLKKKLFHVKTVDNGQRYKKWAFRLLESNYRIYDAKRKGIEYGLFDEGCIQFLTSLYGNMCVEDDVVRSLYDSIYGGNETIIFYCKVDSYINLERLKKRNRNNDRFLTDSDKETLERLEQKKLSIKRAIEAFNLTVIEIDTKNIESAVNECMKHIKDLDSKE